jgi:hypothetical protein
MAVGVAAYKGVMKARSVVLAVFVVLVAVGLAACGASGEKFGTGVSTSGGQLKAFQSELLHPHRYTLKQVKAAFATQGIRLRTMRSRRGGRVVVLFDPRWHAPIGFHLVGGPPSHTYFWVFVHAKAGTNSWVQDGNVYVANGKGQGPGVEAALHKLDLSSKH